ncbi:hypothetical protein [Thalassorhabdomicrobium marinisediminis]|nr:hypothetical protein [Thalassorhabdomicrobium marinisediminis]
MANYEEGLARMTRVKQVFDPDPVMQEHYAARYRTYLGLTEAMQGFWATQ